MRTNVGGLWRGDGTRQLLSFMRSQGESTQAWEGMLSDLYRSGLKGRQLQLIVTDGCPGLATAIQTIYPRVLHQRSWVHKMRNITEHARKCDRDELEQAAQAIYQAENRQQARLDVSLLETALAGSISGAGQTTRERSAELIVVLQLSQTPLARLRTTKIIERCFVEARVRTRPMVCFVNVQSVERIIYSIFHRFKLEWKTRTLRVFTQAA